MPVSVQYRKVKVKISRYRPDVAQMLGRGIALLFHDAALEGGEWSAARPGRTLPPGKDPVPILQEAVRTPGAGLDGRKIWSLPGFHPRPSSP